MSKENNLTDFLTDVADAIREKKGTSEKINPQDFSSEIRRIGQAPSQEEEEGEPEYVESMTIDVSEYKDKYENTQKKIIGTLTFKRKLNAGAWNAFFVPFEVPLSALMENYDIAYFNDVGLYDEDNNGSIETVAVEYVTFTEDYRDKNLYANHPYRIRPKNEDAANMNLVLTDVELQKTEKTNRKVLRCGGVYTNIEWHGLYERSYASDFLDGNNANDMCFAENKKGTFQNIGTYSAAPFRVMMVMTNSNKKPYII